jgi:hypothetical protein
MLSYFEYSLITPPQTNQTGWNSFFGDVIQGW